MLTNSARIASGASRPSAYGSVSFPYLVGPYGSSLSALNWSNPNGTWMLYVYDDSPGDSGVISAGWTLNLVTGPALNPLVDLAVGISSTPATVFAGSAVTNRITVTNLGPISATGVYVAQSLPAGVSFLSQYSPGILSAGQVTFTFGSLPVGGTASVAFVTMPFPGGLANATVVTNAVIVAANEETLSQAHASAQSTTTVYRINPAVLTGSLLGGSYDLTVTAQPGLTYIIQASTDLDLAPHRDQRRQRQRRARACQLSVPCPTASSAPSSSRRNLSDGGARRPAAAAIKGKAQRNLPDAVPWLEAAAAETARAPP